MPKKKGDRINPKSLANLSPGVRKGQSDGKERLTLRVKPSTKRWLETQGKIGETVDLLCQSAQLHTGFMFGTMRLVNPWRGLVYCAAVQCQQGILSARTSNFKQFGLYSVQGGAEFYCGREFERQELAHWFAGIPLPPDQRSSLFDEFGDIPAIAPNPKSWRWYTIGGNGEERLKTEYKPTSAQLQQVAGAALMLRQGQFYPLIDPFEIWVCDQDTSMPLALVMTGTSLEDVERQTFSPLWRLGTGDLSYDFPTEVLETARDLQSRVNERINTSSMPGRFGFFARIFQRHLNRSATEYLPDGSTTQHPLGTLPEGLLAVPWESERAVLEGYVQR